VATTVGKPESDVLAIVSAVPNPVWVPFTIAVTVAVVIAARTSASLVPVYSDHAIITVVALTASAGVLAAFSGGLDVTNAYYSAKYLYLATLALVPLGVGLTIRTLGHKSGRMVIGIGVSAAAVLATALVAPANPAFSRWTITPLAIVTGDVYGSRDQVWQKIVDYASVDDVRLAWRADPPFDHRVNFMLSVNERGDRLQWSTDFRSALRNYGPDDSIERVCEIGAATDLPVVLVTRDPNLSSEVQLACPNDGVTAELLAPSK